MVNGRPATGTPVGDGSFTVPITLGRDAVATTVDLRVGLRAATAQASLELGPVTASSHFPVSLPVGYPTLNPATIELGRNSYGTDATGSLVATGIPSSAFTAPTRVCLGEPDWDLIPDGAEISIEFPNTGSDGCVMVPADAEVEIEFRLNAQQDAVHQLADGP